MLKDSIKKTSFIYCFFRLFCLAYCIRICMNYLFLFHSIQIQVVFLPLYILLAVPHEDRYYFILSLFTFNWWIHFTRAFLLWCGVDDLPSTVTCRKIASLHPYLVPTMEIPTTGAYDTCTTKHLLNPVVMIIIYKLVFLISAINSFNINSFTRTRNVRTICKTLLLRYKA